MLVLAIVALGLPLIDVMDLEAAAETAARLRRWEFLLTAAAVPVLGGTGFGIVAVCARLLPGLTVGELFRAPVG